MSRFWSALVDKLTPYVPGEQPKGTALVKLNTNENPYGPSAKVLAALKEEAVESLRLYPDPNGDRLKEAVADFYDLSPRQVFVGNGSDEVLAHTFQALLKQSQPILAPDISYSFYPVYCGLYGVDCLTIPLNDRFEIDLADYRRPNGGIIFSNPNAPTGCLLPLAAIESLLEANRDSVVVVDEAYIDFGGDSAAALVAHYPNLLVIQTLSKSRSLAGLRVGFALGDEALIEALERVKNSFNSYPLDRFAITGGAVAMEDLEYFEQCRQRIITSRDALAVTLQGLGFQVLPSAANFLFARHPEESAEMVAQRLREKGIIVRYFNKPRIDQFLRITVGTEEECGKLCSALEEILHSS